MIIKTLSPGCVNSPHVAQERCLEQDTCQDISATDDAGHLKTEQNFLLLESIIVVLMLISFTRNVIVCVCVYVHACKQPCKPRFLVCKKTRAITCFISRLQCLLRDIHNKYDVELE